MLYCAFAHLIVLVHVSHFTVTMFLFVGLCACVLDIYSKLFHSYAFLRASFKRFPIYGRDTIARRNTKFRTKGKAQLEELPELEELLLLLLFDFDELALALLLSLASLASLPSPTGATVLYNFCQRACVRAGKKHRRKAKHEERKERNKRK